MVTYRSAELFDIVADCIGIAVGLIIAMAGLGGWSLRIENWYVGRGAGAGID
jgi:VanZ family protein